MQGLPYSQYQAFHNLHRGESGLSNIALATWPIDFGSDAESENLYPSFFSNPVERIVRVTVFLKSLGSWDNSYKSRFNRKDSQLIQCTDLSSDPTSDIRTGQDVRFLFKISHLNDPIRSGEDHRSLNRLRIWAFQNILLHNPLTTIWKKRRIRIIRIGVGSDVY